MTWPRSLDQEPINVGDDDYDPLYPYGYGLRTRGHRRRLAAAPIQASGVRGPERERSASSDLGSEHMATGGQPAAAGREAKPSLVDIAEEALEGLAGNRPPPPG